MIFNGKSQEGGLPGGWGWGGEGPGGCLQGMWGAGGQSIFLSGPKFPPRQTDFLTKEKEMLEGSFF